jgi:hypothetical protein
MISPAALDDVAGPLPSAKVPEIRFLMTDNTPATAQEKPRVGEQHRQREVR